MNSSSSQVNPASGQEILHGDHQPLVVNLDERPCNTNVIASQRSQNAYYSLEQEFLSSASLPR